ncbi:MAG: ATP:cob(I)alamin adenosyltransferase [Pseudomonadota bacterium]
MVKLNKIYTKKGDDGYTALGCGGARVLKNDERVVAMGAVDELNCALGLAYLHVEKDFEAISQ